MDAFGRREDQKSNDQVLCSTCCILIPFLLTDIRKSEHWRTFTACMQAIIPEWIALIHWNRSTASPHTRGPMHEEEEDILPLSQFGPV